MVENLTHTSLFNILDNVFPLYYIYFQEDHKDVNTDLFFIDFFTGWFIQGGHCLIINHFWCLKLTFAKNYLLPWSMLLTFLVAETETLPTSCWLYAQQIKQVQEKY